MPQSGQMPSAMPSPRGQTLPKGAASPQVPAPDPERVHQSVERLRAVASLLQTVPGLMAQLGYTTAPLERGLRFWAAKEVLMLGVLSYDMQRTGHMATIHVIGEGDMEVLDQSRGTIGTGTLVALTTAGHLMAARGPLQCRDLDDPTNITQLPQGQGGRFAPLPAAETPFVPEVLDEIYDRLVLRLPGMTENARERFRDVCSRTDRAVLQPILRALLLRPDAAVREWALRTIMVQATAVPETLPPQKPRGRGSR